MTAFDEDEIKRRVPVWSALSGLFVGKELQGYDYAYLAESLRDSGYSIPQLETILNEEVTPVFHFNLGLLALPEHEGWADESVKDLILEKLHARPTLAEAVLPKKWLLKMRLGYSADIVRDRWNIVKSMAVLNESETTQRKPVWKALSVLFAGKILQDQDYEGVARVLRDSGYKIPQLETILNEEVEPLFLVNLCMSGFPVMEVSPDDAAKNLFLEKLYAKPTLIERLSPTKRLLKQRLNHAEEIVRDRWRVVKDMLLK